MLDPALIRADQSFDADLLDVSAISSSVDSLDRALSNLKAMQEFSNDEASQEAQRLGGLVLRFRDRMTQQSAGNAEELTDYLKQKQILFIPCSKLLDWLVDPDMQFADEFKEAISRAVSIFLDLLVFQCGVQKRSLYPETWQTIEGKIKTVLSTLPEKEVATRHEIRCILSALRTLKYESGISSAQVQAAVPPVLAGLVKAPLSVAAKSVGQWNSVSAEQLLGPLGELCIGVYDYFRDRREATKWYPDVWAMRWCGVNRSISTFSQIEAMNPILDKYSESRKIAYCIAELFGEIIRNPEAEPFLKGWIFVEADRKDKRPTLLRLTKFKPNRFRIWAKLAKDKFRDVRYIALAQLRFLAEEDQFSEQSIEAILKRRFKDTGIVKRLAGEIAAELAGKEPAKWDRILHQMDLRANQEKFNRKESQWKRDLEQLARDIPELQAALRKAQQQGSSVVQHNTATYRPDKLKEAIEERELLVKEREAGIAALNQMRSSLEVLDTVKGSSEPNRWQLLRVEEG